MAFQAKIEPGFPSTSHRNYKEMNISELVSILRIAFCMEDFDKVEQELVSRDTDLKAEIGPLLQKIEFERLMRIQAEQELKKSEEQCERGKRAQESYEMLLKEVKRNGLVDENTIGELRNKNLALERENCGLKELKQKWVDDSSAVAELRIRVRVLEYEKVDDRKALDALKRRNTELEEVVKKNLGTIEELRSEKCKLADEKRGLEEELKLRVVKLEDDIKLLMSVDDCVSGAVNIKVEPPADPRVTSSGVKDKEDVSDYKLGNYTGDLAPLQTNEETQHSPSPNKGNKDDLGTSAEGRLELKKVEIINLDDDDEDGGGCTSRGLLANKAISQIIAKNEPQSSLDAVQHIKRKYSFSDVDTSTSDSSSSTDSLNVDDIPLRSRAITYKKRSIT